MLIDPWGLSVVLDACRSWLGRLRNLNREEAGCLFGIGVVVVIVLIFLLATDGSDDDVPIASPTTSESQQEPAPPEPPTLAEEAASAASLIQLCVDLTNQGLADLSLQLDQVQAGQPPSEHDMRVTIALLRSGGRCSIDAYASLQPWMAENEAELATLLGEQEYELMRSQLADFDDAGRGLLESVDVLEVELLQTGVLTPQE